MFGTLVHSRVVRPLPPEVPVPPSCSMMRLLPKAMSPCKGAQCVCMWWGTTKTLRDKTSIVHQLTQNTQKHVRHHWLSLSFDRSTFFGVDLGVQGDNAVAITLKHHMSW